MLFFWAVHIIPETECKEWQDTFDSRIFVPTQRFVSYAAAVKQFDLSFQVFINAGFEM